jgi:hypothetical protein
MTLLTATNVKIRSGEELIPAKYPQNIEVSLITLLWLSSCSLTVRTTGDAQLL